jgi:hypothetical protein
MGEGEGVDEEPNHTTRESLNIYKSFNILSYVYWLAGKDMT